MKMKIQETMKSSITSFEVVELFSQIEFLTDQKRISDYYDIEDLIDSFESYLFVRNLNRMVRSESIQRLREIYRIEKIKKEKKNEKQ
jgi:hypothetical protein